MGGLGPGQGIPVLHRPALGILVHGELQQGQMAGIQSLDQGREARPALRPAFGDLAIQVGLVGGLGRLLSEAGRRRTLALRGRSLMGSRGERGLWGGGLATS